MPILTIETNVPLDAVRSQELARKASALCARLCGKPEQWVLASVNAVQAIVFAGSDAPAARVALKSIGLNTNDCAGLSKELAGFLEAELGVAPGRAYIEFVRLEGGLVGWNGGTF